MDSVSVGDRCFRDGDMTNDVPNSTLPAEPAGNFTVFIGSNVTSSAEGSGIRRPSLRKATNRLGIALTGFSDAVEVEDFRLILVSSETAADLRGLAGVDVSLRSGRIPGVASVGGDRGGEAGEGVASTGGGGVRELSSE